MFWKKPQPDQPGQSQSISGTQINNAQVQQTQAGRDATANQSGNVGQQQSGITGADVVKLLEELEAAIQGAGLANQQQEKAIGYLKVAKLEATEENADKEQVAKNLKKVGEALATVDKVSDAGKNLWQKGQEVFGAIAPWLGIASKVLGF